MKKHLLSLLALLMVAGWAQAANQVFNCGDSAWISATPTFGYHFVQWNDGNTENPRAILVSGDSVFTASFAINRYAIVYMNDGAEIYRDTVNHGVLPVYGGATPTRTSTPKYTFTFSGWSPALVNAVADAEYAAVYDTTINQYSIRFQNYDGAELQTLSVYYDSLPRYSGATPTKAASVQYSYAFKGWEPQLTTVTGAATYTADFDSIVNKYLISFLNENGDTLYTDSVAYGATPVYGGATPTKPATAQYTYTFNTWNTPIVAVTGDASYTATYTATVNRYDVTLTGENGVVTGAGNYAYGDEVTIIATANECYTFTSWSDQNTNASRTFTVTGNVTLEAIFDVKTFTITVESANEAQGSVSISTTRP